MGDVKPVGRAVRIDHGPGDRVHVTQRGTRLVILLCAGDNASQNRDIAKAHALAAAWKDEA